MSLNVNYTSLYKNGIDTSMLKEVSKEILNRAAVKNSQYTNGLSVSQQVNAGQKPVEIGLDLYQGRLDTSVQKQISMNNTLQFQLNNETLKSIQFLNSQAAIANRTDGKYMPVINAAQTESQKISESNKSQFMSIFTSEASKDKNGSNPFYFGELLSRGKKDDQKQSDNEMLKSIFA